MADPANNNGMVRNGEAYEELSWNENTGRLP